MVSRAWWCTFYPTADSDLHSRRRDQVRRAALEILPLILVAALSVPLLASLLDDVPKVTTAEQFEDGDRADDLYGVDPCLPCEGPRIERIGVAVSEPRPSVGVRDASGTVPRAPPAPARHV
jgi:hypothetical protein